MNDQHYIDIGTYMPNNYVPILISLGTKFIRGILET